ncbi:MAG: substrate-binding domain-containing protein [Lachnospiraceae bacterium]|nr:substrate-binding domain-containing protein [Lachnospiraceae bacterium]
MEIKYKALAESLKKEIIRRGPLGNQKLPTEAELMRAYGVSRQTVRQALSLLHKGGWIEKRQGSGTYIAPGLFPSALSSREIALLVPDVAEYLSHYHIGETEAVLNEAGYTTAIYSTENHTFREREILQNLLDKPVRGILVRGVRTAFPNPNISLYQELLSRGTIVVFLGETYPELRSDNKSDFPTQGQSDSSHNMRTQNSFSKNSVLQVSSDDFGGGELLTRHLTELGHKKIAGIFRLDDHSGPARYAGVLHALCENGLAFDDRDFLWYDPLNVRMPDSRVLLSFIRIQLTGCTAAVCQDDTIATALIRELQRLGMPVPQRFSVAAFASARETRPSDRITSVFRSSQDPWHIAAELLLNRLTGKTVSSVSCPWTLLPGESTERVN